MTDNPFDLAFAGFTKPEPEVRERRRDAEPPKPPEPEFLITEPGAYADIPAETYHGHEICDSPSISASGLRLIDERSPAHYWEQSPLNPNRKPPEQKRHYTIGHLLHDILCYGGMLPADYHIVPDGFTPAHRNKWADEMDGWREAVAAGSRILHRGDFELGCRMAESVEKNELACALLKSGEPEMTLAAKDPKTGRWLRARPDILPATMEIIPDVKSTINAHPDAFSKAATAFGYFQAAAHYLDVIEMIYGEAKRSFVDIAIEKEPPYLVQLYALDDGDIHEARMLNRRALNLFDRCLTSGVWHGYSRPGEPILSLGLTEWKRKQINKAVERGELSYEL